MIQDTLTTPNTRADGDRAASCCSPFLDLRCCDNMELMSQYPDNHFDLAIVDKGVDTVAYPKYK